MTRLTISANTVLGCSAGRVKNEIRCVELMIAPAQDRTLYNVLSACQEKHLLGLEIVENDTELLDLRSRKMYFVENRLKQRFQ
jgi:hypothetical protein